MVAAAALRKRLFHWCNTQGVEGDGDGVPGAADWKNPGFWIMSVTLSGLISWAALHFLKVDFSESYSLGEVVLLWLLSLTVFPALLVPLAWVLGKPLDIAAKILKHRLQDRYLVSQDDNAATVLQKLYLAGLGVYLPTIEWPARGRNGELFLLLGKNSGPDVWGIPPIVIVGKKYSHEKARRIDVLLDDPAEQRVLLETVLRDCGLRKRLFGAPWPKAVAALQVAFEDSKLDKPIQIEKDKVRNALDSAVPRSLLRRGRTW
jgi:hypothetical protein